MGNINIRILRNPRIGKDLLEYENNDLVCDICNKHSSYYTKYSHVKAHYFDVGYVICKSCLSEGIDRINKELCVDMKEVKRCENWCEWCKEDLGKASNICAHPVTKQSIVVCNKCIDEMYKEYGEDIDIDNSIRGS